MSCQRVYRELDPFVTGNLYFEQLSSGSPERGQLSIGFSRFFVRLSDIESYGLT